MLFHMSDVPTDISADREKATLTISWPDRKDVHSFAQLREHCQCAHCVNEWTGEKILDPSSIPRDITIEKMEAVGGYAVRIHWSDGHSSGLYTWERLRQLGV